MNSRTGNLSLAPVEHKGGSEKSEKKRRAALSQQWERGIQKHKLFTHSVHLSRVSVWIKLYTVHIQSLYYISPP